MLLFKNDFSVTDKIIRGTQYIVFSIYDDKEIVIDKVEKQIENSFEKGLDIKEIL